MKKTASHASALRTAADKLRPYCDGGSVVYASMGALTFLILCLEGICDIKLKLVPALSLLMIAVSVFYLIVLALRKRLTDNVQSVLMLCFFAWFTVTRMLLGDVTLEKSYIHIAVIAFGSILCFNFPRLIESEKVKNNLLKYITLFLCLFSVVMSALSIIDMVFNLDKGPIFSNIYIDKHAETRLNFLTFHPIVAGMYSNIGICATLILFALTKSRVLRALYAVSMPIQFAMFGPTNARASMMLSGICVGAAVSIWLFRRLGDKKITGRRKLDRVILTGLCAVMTAALVFAAMSYASLAANVITTCANNRISQSAQSYTTETVSDPEPAGSYAEPEDNDEQIHINERELQLKTWMTLHGRTYVFKHIFKLIREDPKIAVIGNINFTGPFYVEVNDRIKTAAHAHNSYIAVLYASGVPGLLLCVSFTVLVVIQMIKVFFGSFKKYQIKHKIIVLPLASLFATSILEPILYTPYDKPRFYFIDLLLLIYAGYLYSYYRRGNKSQAPVSEDING